MKSYRKTLVPLAVAIGFTGIIANTSFAQTPTTAPNAANTTTESQNTTPTATSITKGKKLATKLCSRCHNIEKTGKSTVYLAPPFRTFASKWPLQDLEEALAEGIVVGHSIMPEFELETDDITALLDFMGDLAKKAGLVKK